MSPKAPQRRVDWRSAVRIIPSLYPRRNLFERVAPREEEGSLKRIDDLTNSRRRELRGELRLVAPYRPVTGPVSGFIMGPFCQPHPNGSRFCDGSFGAFYASRALDTAIHETVYHTARFLLASKFPATWRGMLVLKANVSGRFDDVRKAPRPLAAALRHPADYARSQRFGRERRDALSAGIVYRSVRRQGGECVAVFDPQRISNCRQDRFLVYVWDGERVSAVHRVTEHPYKAL